MEGREAKGTNKESGRSPEVTGRIKPRAVTVSRRIDGGFGGTVEKYTLGHRE